MSISEALLINKMLTFIRAFSGILTGCQRMNEDVLTGSYKGYRLDIVDLWNK